MAIRRSSKHLTIIGTKETEQRNEFTLASFVNRACALEQNCTVLDSNYLFVIVTASSIFIRSLDKRERCNTPVSTDLLAIRDRL
jgi:hypothetical protein